MHGGYHSQHPETTQYVKRERLTVRYAIDDEKSITRAHIRNTAVMDERLSEKYHRGISVSRGGVGHASRISTHGKAQGSNLDNVNKEDLRQQGLLVSKSQWDITSKVCANNIRR